MISEKVPNTSSSPLVSTEGGPDWEAAYQAGVTPWDKGRAHPALLRWLDLRASVSLPDYLADLKTGLPDPAKLASLSFSIQGPGGLCLWALLCLAFVF